MKNALELMREKVKTTDSSFTLRSEDPTDLNSYSFMYMSVGKARLIYGFTVNANDSVGMKDRAELIAVLANETIYLYIKSWEQAMYKALHSLDAKAVTVTFEKAGTQETEKIDPAKIVQMLIDNDDFSYWDFTVSKNGKQLMEKLCPKRERLICEDIVKITYGKKTLYER